MKTPFAYLHVHSKYSIGDSATDPKEYVRAIYRYMQQETSRYQITHLALTEHGLFNSPLKLKQACELFKDEGFVLTPIYGIEMYHCEAYNGTQKNERHHLCLYAKTQEGLQHLFEIASYGGRHRDVIGNHLFPLVETSYLLEHAKGLIATSACLSGQIPKLLLEGTESSLQKAKELCHLFAEAFDEFYLEVQPHDIPEQLLLNQKLVELSQELNLPLVMGTDAHYVEEADRPYHDILKQLSKLPPYTTLNDLKSPEVLEAYCLEHGLPLSCLTNTTVIANQCHVRLEPEDKRGFLPTFKTPTGFTETSYLQFLTIQYLELYLKEHPEEDANRYIDQLNYELDVIGSAGFSGYFLILWDWIRWCRKNGIITGPGRGSAAGSLVAYVLKITKVNPIKHHFIFERFMNPERLAFPDIDVDVATSQRQQAIQYFVDKYGSDYTAQIITYQEYQLKNTIQAVNTAFELLPSDEINRITKSIPSKVGDDDASFELIEKIALQLIDVSELSDSVIRQCTKAYESLKNLFIMYPEMEAAVKKLRGAIKTMGVHPGGVIVSRLPLPMNLPILKAKNDSALLPVLQLEMDDLDYFKVLKIDALGLSTLDIIRHAMQLIGLNWYWYDHEGFEDPHVYELLRRGLTTDIFQLSKYQPTKMCRDFKVKDLDGLTAVNAGNRPGPLATIEGIGKSMVDLYVEGLNHPDSIVHYDPRIDAVLQNTYGCIWYQEDLIKIGQVMAGYSLGSADSRIRKTMCKKIKSLLPELKNEFVYGKKTKYSEAGEPIGCSTEPSPYCIGAINNGFDEALALKIFDMMEKFASYSFNRSHSGCYSALSYKTAWLSCYFPAEYAIACITSYRGDLDKILHTITLCRKRGIRILPPSLNHSSEDFKVELTDGRKDIRFGLASIKGLNKKVKPLLELCQQFGPFHSFLDYYEKCHGQQALMYLRSLGYKTNPIDIGVDKTLILAGVFDSFETNRYRLMNLLCTQLNPKREFKPLDEESFTLSVAINLEKDYLSTFVSRHPLEDYPYRDLANAKENEWVQIAGTMTDYKNAKQSNGKTYAWVRFEAKDGTEYRANFFGKAFENYRSSFAKKKPFIFTGKYSPSYKSILIQKLEPISS